MNNKNDFKSTLSIRVFDLLISGVGLLFLSPVFLFISLAIKLASKGPVFYKAERVGRGGRLFNVYKFRSMVSNTEGVGSKLTLENDPRITSVGRFLRRTKLDELPQLINVIRGEMSIVGPRPEDSHYVKYYTQEQRRLLSIRPGITGPASIYYQQEESLLNGDDWESVYIDRILPHKLALDMAYFEKRTLRTDSILMLKTLGFVFYGNIAQKSVFVLKNRSLLLLDIIALCFIPALALSLRLDGWNWWQNEGQGLIFFTFVALLVKMFCFSYFGLYRRYWRYANVNDLMQIFYAVSLSTVFLIILFSGGQPYLKSFNLHLPRTIPVLDGMLTFFIIGGYRLGLKGLYYWYRQFRAEIGGRPVLVVGAGEAGAMIVREMQANSDLNLKPVAFVDDDTSKVGNDVVGLKVVGTTAQISKWVAKFQIKHIVVAMPSVSLAVRRKIMDKCKSTGIATDSLPGMYEILAGYKTISLFPKIDINLLLHRNPVVISQDEVSKSLNGTSVLVTGAGGSIGRELCHQIASFKPAEIILLGHGENSIFEVSLDLKLAYPDLRLHRIIGDIRDRRKIDWVVDKYKPSTIFHAAAHKHVHFMESNVEEAITNNVLGTKNVLRAAEEYGVERFVLISTDKAIKPKGVMGKTKRIAEFLVLAAAQRSNRHYIAVRFGNVLGSRGSVIPVFQRQIAAGGPVTITHPDMVRYFMTIPEAVQLVLQASVLGKGGDLFVLDMGEPVRIYDLAIDLIKLSGLEPERDIKLSYTGVRPGEKLREEIFAKDESYCRTKHSKIFTIQNHRIIDEGPLEDAVTELCLDAKQLQNQNLYEKMEAIIHRFQSKPSQSKQSTKTKKPIEKSG